MAMRRLACSVWLKAHHRLSSNYTGNPLEVKAAKSSEAIGKKMLTFGRPLTDLPVTTKLNLSGETVIVDNLKKEDLTEAFQLLELAAKRGDNVGVDEYRNVGDYLVDTQYGSILTVRNPRSGAIDALVRVGPCLAARTIRPCLGSLKVVTSEGFARESVWRDCFDMAIGYARQHPFGLSACVTEVFANCLERITALRKDGFVICASVPLAGKVILRIGSTPSYMNSYLMYKEFGPADSQRPSWPEFIELSKELSKTYDNNEQGEYVGNVPDPAPVPPIPGLPAEHLLSHSSSPMSVIVRQFRSQPEDLDIFYDFYRLAGEDDDGYSIEEFPTKELFWKIFRSHYTAVFEEKNSGKWVAVLNLGPTLFSRTRGSSDILDGGLIVGKEFRSAGIGTQLLRIQLSIARSLGCRVLFSDAPIYDVASNAISLRNNFVFAGTLPRAIYSPTYGWTDVLLVNAALYH